MATILIGGEKGGTGKSTIATNLAIMSSMMGKDVLLLDVDKQASSVKFIERRKDKCFKFTPPCLQLSGNHLNKELQDLKRRYETIIIDSGGHDSPELRAAMASPVVEKMYSPLKPSYFDLETLNKLDEISYLAKSFNADLEVKLIFTNTPTHSKVTLFEEALELSNEYLEYITPLNIYLSNRIPFIYAPGDSLSIVEFDLNHIESMPPYRAKNYIPKASIEMCNLYKEVFNETFSGKINDFFEKKVKEEINEE